MNIHPAYTHIHTKHRQTHAQHTCKILLKHSSDLGCNGLHCSDASKRRIRVIIQVRNATKDIIAIVSNEITTSGYSQ